MAPGMMSVISYPDDHKSQRCWSWWNRLTLLPFWVSRWVTAIQSRSNKGTIKYLHLRTENVKWIRLWPPRTTAPPFPSLNAFALAWAWLLGQDTPGPAEISTCCCSSRAAACLLSSQVRPLIYYKNWILDWHYSSVALFLIAAQGRDVPSRQEGIASPCHQGGGKRLKTQCLIAHDKNKMCMKISPFVYAFIAILLWFLYIL